LISDILNKSRSSLMNHSAWQLKDRRDLKSSAIALGAKGIIPIIAEIKPLVLGRPLNQDEVAQYARKYEAYNACAISVLTQPVHFLGSLENLRIAREGSKIPILRKDFIFDEMQLREVQSDLVLLIASLQVNIRSFVETAYSLGMEPLVEVHSEKELDQVLKTDATVIGINNRDLETLTIDLGNFERLAPLVKDSGVFLVAESGVHSRQDAFRMRNAGADAILIGTALMERPELLAHFNDSRPTSVSASPPSSAPPYIL
jgi:indole-3-glycerol phosphate synthase